MTIVLVVFGGVFVAGVIIAKAVAWLQDSYIRRRKGKS